jgi:two-component system CheB/CheR fusion protein
VEAVTDTIGVDWTKAPKRVLIVEDNLDSVHTLAFLLEDIGHIVEWAINGYAALEMALLFRPDFVLLDLSLPGLDGFQVARLLRRHPELKDTRFVALTAFGQGNCRKLAKEAGIAPYLVKPVPTQTLQDLLG